MAGVLITVFAVSVLLLPAAMLINREVVGTDAIWILDGICLAAAMFLSVRLVSAYRRKQQLKLGTCIFAAIVTIFFLMRLITGGEGEWINWSMTICLPGLLGMFAGVLAAGTREKRKKTGRRR